jgi:hypothetical protein
VAAPPTPTSTAPSVQPLSTVATVNYRSDSGGYTWTVTAAFGTIRAANDPSVDQQLIAACGVDASTAGFIPMQVTATSTETQFPEDMAASFDLSRDGTGAVANVPIGDSFAASFADGPHCDSTTSSTGHPWTVTYSQIAPGGTAGTKGGLVIENWKSPAYPNGTPVSSNLWLAQAGRNLYTGTANWDATDATGPIVVATGAPFTTNDVIGWDFPIGASG